MTQFFEYNLTFPGLDEFKVIKYSERIGSACIDLSVSYNHNPNSNIISVKDEPFAIVFAPSFAKCCKKYDFTGLGEVSLKELGDLIKDLKLNNKVIGSIETDEQFVEYIGRKNTAYPTLYKVAPKKLDIIFKYKKAMLEMNDYVVKYCEDVLENSGIMWIHGL